MKLIVQGSPTYQTVHLPKFLAENISVASVDLDDTLYDSSTGLHDQIKARIIADANANGSLDDLRQRWAHDGKISSDGKLSNADLGWAFPPIVDYYRSKGFEKLTAYLRHVYDVDYSVIAPQPAIVDAVEKWRAAGKEIVLYTNGPWSAPEDRPLHVNKVLHRLGFSQDAFTERHIVDLLKTNRNPQLLKYFGVSLNETSSAFLKATTEGFGRMAQALNFSPGPHVAFFDDSLANIDAARPFGALRIHMAAHKKDAVAPEAEHKRDFVVWTESPNDCGKCSSFGLLMQEVVPFLPKQKPNQVPLDVLSRHNP